MLPRVTIVGRPNVGKSSLVNALVGLQTSIVSEEANTTRDLVEHRYRDETTGLSYVLIDSGGLVIGSEDQILRDVRSRVEKAVQESDLIVFVVEYDKITELDDAVTKMLRRSKKPVILVANKADNKDRENEAYGALALGFDDFHILSVVHRRGVQTLRTGIADRLTALGFTPDKEMQDSKALKIALIGRPNVGKSSLVNALLGYEKSIVSPVSGTTRDSVDSLLEFEGKEYILIDTAGIRRSGKIGIYNIESYAVLRAERAIERADVVVVVIDGMEGVTAQDCHVIERAVEARKCLLIAVNKWDLVRQRPNVTLDGLVDRYDEYLLKVCAFVKYVPHLFMSAEEGIGVQDILKQASVVAEERFKRVKTSVFNTFLREVAASHAPTGNKKTHRPKMYYGSQVTTDPPKFLISVNNSRHFHFSYIRYLENKIRSFFGFSGTPIEIELKSRESIFDNKKGGLKKTPQNRKIHDERVEKASEGDMEGEFND